MSATSRPGTCLLLLLSAGAGLVVVGAPARASTTEGEAPATSPAERRALDLLEEAARAARSRAWSGTQWVATWSGSGSSARTVELEHDPATGTRVTAGETAETVRSPAADLRLLGQLAARYQLAVAGSERCSGRAAHVVEARRADGRVAGRFWIDSATSLPLRREVWDPAGRPLRSSSFVSLEVGGGDAVGSPVEHEVVRPDDAGWEVPAALPGGYALFDAGRPEHDGGSVTHLAYSDGLSTVSVFSQPGSLGRAPGEGFREERVAGSRVWVHDGSPRRLVWSGAGQVFTVVSDAGPDDVRAVVAALPHDGVPEHGPAARLQRGLARVASWVNPLA